MKIGWGYGEGRAGVGTAIYSCSLASITTLSSLLAPFRRACLFPSLFAELLEVCFPHHTFPAKNVEATEPRQQ